MDLQFPTRSVTECNLSIFQDSGIPSRRYIASWAVRNPEYREIGKGRQKSRLVFDIVGCDCRKKEYISD